MTKRFVLLLVTSIVGVLIGMFTTSFLSLRQVAQAQVMYGVWASPAMTVSEETAAADVIIRVQVKKVQPARKLEAPLPSEVQQNGFKKMVMPFTDSNVDVLKVYRGTVGKSISIMQTGGVLAKTDDHPAMNLEMEGDPRLVEGQEYVLFLTDISGDEKHAKNRQLYRIVNAAGRYDVHGDAVESHNEFPQSYRPPQSLNELETQIQQALVRK